LRLQSVKVIAFVGDRANDVGPKRKIQMTAVGLIKFLPGTIYSALSVQNKTIKVKNQGSDHVRVNVSLKGKVGKTQIPQFQGVQSAIIADGRLLSNIVLSLKTAVPKWNSGRGRIVRKEKGVGL
jgi:hypothetical protein